MAKGIVKCFDDAKGYGFISRNNIKDVFVHWTAIVDEGRKTLIEGQSVSFEVVKQNGKLRAINVKVTAQPKVVPEPKAVIQSPEKSNYVNPFTAILDPEDKCSGKRRTPSVYTAPSHKYCRAGIKFRFLKLK